MADKEKTKEKLRKTGIGIIGDVSWGTHLCQFYKTKEDLINILVPYFKAGLENNEFCMWVTSEPLRTEDAEGALKKAVKNLDDYIKKDQIEILDYGQWYTKSGKFEAEKALQGWVEKEKQAIKRGFDGLRLTGNTFWIAKKDWKKFADYEAVVNNVIGKYQMLAICTYSLDKCDASEIIDVVSNHQFALISTEGKWELIESTERKKAEEELKATKDLYQSLVENIDFGVTLIDPEYRILMTNAIIGKWFNEDPKKFIAKNCFREFEKRNAICPHCPGKKAMATGKSHFADTEGVREDGSHFSVRVHAFPLFDAESKPKGFIEVIEEITERKKMEEEIKQAAEEWIKTFDAISDLVFTQDKDFNITRVNRAFAEALKSKPEDIIGKKCYELLHKSDKPWPECPFVMTQKDKKPSMREIDDPNIGIPLLVTTSPIFDDKGEVIGSAHVARDISEMKKAEEELKKKIHDLERFHKVTVGREMEMVKLKEEINALLEKLGQPKKYEAPGKIKGTESGGA